MECQICHQQMKLVREDISVGKKKKEYHRRIYTCEQDDVWISVEVPYLGNVA